MNFVNNQVFFCMAVLCSKSSGKMIYNSCAPQGERQRKNSKKIKFKICRGPDNKTPSKV